MINPTAPDTTDEIEEFYDEEPKSHKKPDLDQNTLKKIKAKSLEGVTSYFIRTIFIQGIALLSTSLLGYWLTPADFGTFGFVTKITGFLTFFSDVGLASSLIRKKEEPSLTEYRTAFTVQQLLSYLIVATAMFLTWTGMVSNQVGREGNWVLLSLAISFPLANLKTISSIKLQRKLQFSKIVIPQIIEQVTYHSILIFTAYQNYGVLSYAYAVIARSIIGVITMWVIQPWKIGFKINIKSLKDLLNFGVKFQLNDFLARIKDQLFYIFIKNYISQDNFGYIQWANMWSMQPYNLTVQNIMAITFPTFSKLQKKKKHLSRAIEKSIYFITLVIFPILVGMSIFIYPLTQIVPKYDKWEPAIFSFIAFTINIAWAAISTPLINSLNAIGKINETLKLMVLWTVMTWILSPILVFTIGFNGVALSSLIISFTSFLSINLVKKYLTVKIWKNIKVQSISALNMTLVGILGMQLWSQNLTLMLSGMITVSATYLISVLVFGRKKLLSEIMSFIKK